MYPLWTPCFTPKIEYPTQYFWSITNHGINEIARQDGLGFSLIRPKLENSAQGRGEEKERGKEKEGERGHHVQPRGPPSGTPVLRGSLSRSPSPLQVPSPGRIMTSRAQDKGGDIEMEDLTRAMSSSLSFLPRGVRKSRSGRARGGRGLDT